jgi:hypothetical protein
MTSISETSSYGRNCAFASRSPKSYEHVTDRSRLEVELWVTEKTNPSIGVLVLSSRCRPINRNYMIPGGDFIYQMISVHLVGISGSHLMDCWEGLLSKFNIRSLMRHIRHPVQHVISSKLNN